MPTLYIWGKQVANLKVREGIYRLGGVTNYLFYNCRVAKFSDGLMLLGVESHVQLGIMPFCVWLAATSWDCERGARGLQNLRYVGANPTPTVIRKHYVSRCDSQETHRG